MRYLVILAVLFIGCGKPESVVGPRGEVGDTGAQGLPGQDAEIEVIELCPTIAGDGFHEYLLRIEGDLFGVYAQGQRIFMTRLRPGSYATTDGRDCQFSVTQEGSVQ
jgi:hypothetical protein